MNPDRRNLFDQLEPPPGGTEQFRRRLERLGARSPRVNGKLLVAGAAAALLTAVVIGIIGQTERPGAATGTVNDAQNETGAQALAEAPQFARLLGRPIASTDLRVAVNEEPVSVTEVPSTDPKIRIYEIERD